MIIRSIFDGAQQKILLDRGYNLDADVTDPHPVTKSSIIHDAIVDGQSSIIKTLFEKVEKTKLQKLINQRDTSEDPFRYSKTPILLAISYDQIDTLKLLLDYGADGTKPQKDGKTPLMMAAVEGSQDALNLLLEKTAVKADIDRENSNINAYGEPTTALMYASQFGHLSAIKLLIANGAKRTNSKGKNFIDSAYNEKTKSLIKDNLTEETKPSMKNTELTDSYASTSTSTSTPSSDSSLSRKNSLSSDELIKENKEIGSHHSPALTRYSTFAPRSCYVRGVVKDNQPFFTGYLIDALKKIVENNNLDERSQKQFNNFFNSVSDQDKIPLLDFYIRVATKEGHKHNKKGERDLNPEWKGMIAFLMEKRKECQGKKAISLAMN